MEIRKVEAERASTIKGRSKMICVWVRATPRVDGKKRWFKLLLNALKINNTYERRQTTFGEQRVERELTKVLSAPPYWMSSKYDAKPNQLSTSASPALQRPMCRQEGHLYSLFSQGVDINSPTVDDENEKPATEVSQQQEETEEHLNKNIVTRAENSSSAKDAASAQKVSSHVCASGWQETLVQAFVESVGNQHTYEITNEDQLLASNVWKEGGDQAFATFCRVVIFRSGSTKTE